MFDYEKAKQFIIKVEDVALEELEASYDTDRPNRRESFRCKMCESKSAMHPTHISHSEWCPVTQILISTVECSNLISQEKQILAKQEEEDWLCECGASCEEECTCNGQFGVGA